MKNQKRIMGFTLVEILISLGIFAMVGIMCSYALRHMIDMHDRINKINQDIANVNIALVLMQRDMQQIVDRPIQDQSGHPLQSILLTGSGMEFTNTANLDPTQRLWQSNLLRISYQLNGDTLTRSIWPVLDRPTTPVTPIQQNLLNHVGGFAIALVAADGQAYNTWPPPGRTSARQGIPMPQAVIITMKIENWGDLKKVIAIPGGQFHVG